mmetsp:Transcript_2618/g.4612  ORF Transcript_2618/g.4612 Transcript_2618/m.4612 type:complete len:234 (+) Transcript_2618:1937-2638(+)
MSMSDPPPHNSITKNRLSSFSNTSCRLTMFACPATVCSDWISLSRRDMSEHFPFLIIFTANRPCSSTFNPTRTIPELPRPRILPSSYGPMHSRWRSSQYSYSRVTRSANGMNSSTFKYALDGVPNSAITRCSSGIKLFRSNTSSSKSIPSSEIAYRNTFSSSIERFSPHSVFASFHSHCMNDSRIPFPRKCSASQWMFDTDIFSITAASSDRISSPSTASSDRMHRESPSVSL